MFSSVKLSERDIDIPGLTRAANLILQVLASFKEKERKNVMPLQYAKDDDIVLMQIRPESFGLDNFVRTGLTVGTVHIIPQTTGNYSVPDKQIFVITDFIEINPTPIITAIRVVNIDGVPQYPIEARLCFKASNLQIFELPHPLIADSSIDIDAKVEAAGDTELTPIGVWIGLGKDVPALT